MKKTYNKTFLTLVLIIIAVVLDQVTKYLAVMHLKGKPAIPIISDVFELQYLENHGAAFGIMQNQQLFFLVTSVLISIVCIYVYFKLPMIKRYNLLRLCLIFIVSGAIGNMIDRIRFQYVIDFLYFKLIDFPIFNVADIYVTVSAIGLVLLILFYYKDDEINEIYSKIRLRKGKTNE